MQDVLFKPESTWTPPNLSELPDWEGHRIACDIESNDADIRLLGPGVRREGSYMCGVGFAIEDGPSFYLPTRHADGGNLDEDQVIAYMKRQAKYFRGAIVGANLGYDLDWLAEYGISFHSEVMARDVQVAEPILDENQFAYNLEAIAERWNLPGKDETLLRDAAACYGVDPKKELHVMHSKYVGGYAERDCTLPHELIRKQERQIEEENLWNVYDMESKLLRAIVAMTRRGIKLDLNRMDELNETCMREELKSLADLKSITGIQFDITDTTKSASMARALDKVGIPYPMTPETKQPSVTNDHLKNLDHPVADAIIRAKKFNKIRTTFVKSIERHMVKGRLYPGYKQMRSQGDDEKESSGVRFGRMSSNHPNIQQQPSKKDEEIGSLWRSIYVPDEGGQWACLDYSQQEPRWTVHFAELEGFVGSYDAGEKYRNDPKADSHQIMGDIIQGRKATKRERDEAKIIFLGICYGMGGAALCKDLGHPTVWKEGKWGRYEAPGPEGQAILDKFHAFVPFVSSLTKMAKRTAEERGFIRTISGRKCRFPVDKDGKVDWGYKALNRLIQGSAADQTKMAMVAAHEAGFAIQTQVHDELDLTIYSMKEAEDLAEIMLNVVTLKVPSKVDIEVGPNWGEVA